MKRIIIVRHPPTLSAGTTGESSDRVYIYSDDWSLSLQPQPSGIRQAVLTRIADINAIAREYY